MKKCEECLHSRPVVSENGYHYICCLSPKKAVNCIAGIKSQFVSLKKNNNT